MVPVLAHHGVDYQLITGQGFVDDAWGQRRCHHARVFTMPASVFPAWSPTRSTPPALPPAVGSLRIRSPFFLSHCYRTLSAPACRPPPVPPGEDGRVIPGGPGAGGGLSSPRLALPFGFLPALSAG